jgi:hypothetical protein
MTPLILKSVQPSPTPTTCPYPLALSALGQWVSLQKFPILLLAYNISGFFWVIIIPGLNQFFFFRYPSVNINGMVAQLLSFPMGRLWASVVPNVTVFGVHLNPGPFTIKEHVLVTIMATVGWQSAYAVRELVRLFTILFNIILPDRHHCRTESLLRSNFQL